MVISGEVGNYLSINPRILRKRDMGGEHFFFSIGQFLGRGATLMEVLILVAKIATRAETFSPNFSSNLLKNTKKPLDPSMVEWSIKLRKSDPEERESDDTLKTSSSYPQTSNPLPIDSPDDEPLTETIITYLKKELAYNTTLLRQEVNIRGKK